MLPAGNTSSNMKLCVKYASHNWFEPASKLACSKRLENERKNNKIIVCQYWPSNRFFLELSESRRKENNSYYRVVINWK